MFILSGAKSIFINILIRIYILKKNVILDGKVIFNGFPKINVHDRASIKIGNNVTINSENEGYHVNMFAPCKLYADKPESRITIGENSRIHGTCIHAFYSIEIGRNCLIAANTQIFDANGHHPCFDNPEERLVKQDVGKPVVIGDNVWIGTGAIIMGGTTIGKNTIVSSGSVVRGNLEANAIYAGNPAVLVKRF